MCVRVHARVSNRASLFECLCVTVSGFMKGEIEKSYWLFFVFMCLFLSVWASMRFVVVLGGDGTVLAAPPISLAQHLFDQINTDLLFKRVNYLYLATFTCSIVFLYPVST